MKQKKIILTLLILVCMTSFSLHAESQKGLYKKKQESEENVSESKSEPSMYKNRSEGDEGGFGEDGEGGGINAPGKNVPVGGGMLLLALFSTGYVVCKQSKKR